jgi:twinkle protein
MRKGEIVTFCAGSGIGKSAVCKEIALHVLKSTDRKLGYIALEESIERTANGIIGLEMSRPLHLEPFEADEAYNKAYKDTVGSGRFFLYDHWGSLDSDNLLGHIRYMAKAMDVDYVVLDHLSIVVSGMGDGDERRMIDNTMTKLRALVEETKIGVILVSHLKRPEGKGHEEGAATSLAQLRGSAAIAQLSDMCIGLERNQQDKENRNRTALRVLKNRFSGETGLACSLLYDKETGRIAEETNPLFETQEGEANPFAA